MSNKEMMLRVLCLLFKFYFAERKKQRIGIQLQEARANFTSIAENHAKALQVTYPVK